MMPGRNQRSRKERAPQVADLWLPVSAGPAVAPELADDALKRPQLAMFQFIGRRRQGVNPPRSRPPWTPFNGKFSRIADNRQLRMVALSRLLPAAS